MYHIIIQNLRAQYTGRVRFIVIMDANAYLKQFQTILIFFVHFLLDLIRLPLLLYCKLADKELFLGFRKVSGMSVSCSLALTGQRYLHYEVSLQKSFQNMYPLNKHELTRSHSTYIHFTGFLGFPQQQLLREGLSATHFLGS